MEHEVRSGPATSRLAHIGGNFNDETTQTLTSGTLGPAATAGLAAAGDIDAMVAFSDPIELRPGDTTTRSLTRLAIFWDIPMASNRATADLLLGTLTAAGGPPPTDLRTAASPAEAEPVRGAIKLWVVRAIVDDVPGRLAILAASLARRAINILSVQVHLTPDGPIDELLVAASPVVALHGRCSMTSRLRRYLAGTRCPTDTTLARLLSPVAGRCLVVEDADGRLVAMANLVFAAAGAPGRFTGDPELALLIEDAWQNRRLGTVLARRLAVFAAQAGAHSIRAVIHAGNTPMLQIMSGLGHRLHREYDGGLLTLIATLGHTQRLPSSMRLIQSS